MKKGSKRKKKQIIRTKINKNKMKSNYEGWDWKKSIKKSIRKKTKNNKKNEDKI
jgi:hypothetical protein